MLGYEGTETRAYLLKRFFVFLNVFNINLMRAGRDFSIEYEGWQERGNFPSFLELRSSDFCFFLVGVGYTVQWVKSHFW